MPLQTAVQLYRNLVCAKTKHFKQLKRCTSKAEMRKMKMDKLKS
jgi:hypothetical protein